MASESKKNEKQKLEEVIQGFQQLRNEQRHIANQIARIDSDLNEHRMVIETLKNVDSNRRCFRMINDVLVETVVKDVQPILEIHVEKSNELLQTLSDKLVKKGVELNEYREKHGIKVHGQGEFNKSKKNEDSDPKSRANVLVS